MNQALRGRGGDGPPQVPGHTSASPPVYMSYLQLCKTWKFNNFLLCWTFERNLSSVSYIVL